MLRWVFATPDVQVSFHPSRPRLCNKVLGPLQGESASRAQVSLSHDLKDTDVPFAPSAATCTNL